MEKNMLKPNELLQAGIITAINKTKSVPIQTLLLGALAGAFIALGGFAAGVASHSITNFSLSKFISGAVFPVGLILVLICGAELFTGNSLMITGLLDKKIELKSMLKNWILVYISNFLGAFIIVILLYFSGSLDLNSGKLGAYAIKVAYHKSSLSSIKAFSSGILCNILVCLAVWGSYAAKDIIGKIFIIWFPIMAFIVSGFEHSIANMYYLTIGFLSKSNPVYSKASSLSYNELSKISLPNILQNLTWVTLGNIVGGALIIGMTYWIIYKNNNKKVISIPNSIKKD